MRQDFTGQRYRRRLRQMPQDNRQRCRSFIPGLLLAVCMLAVLYGNFSVYKVNVKPKDREDESTEVYRDSTRENGRGTEEANANYVNEAPPLPPGELKEYMRNGPMSEMSRGMGEMDNGWVENTGMADQDVMFQQSSGAETTEKQEEEWHLGGGGEHVAQGDALGSGGSGDVGGGSQPQGAAEGEESGKDGEGLAWKERVPSAAASLPGMDGDLEFEVEVEEKELSHERYGSESEEHPRLSEEGEIMGQAESEESVEDLGSGEDVEAEGVESEVREKSSETKQGVKASSSEGREEGTGFSAKERGNEALVVEGDAGSSMDEGGTRASDGSEEKTNFPMTEQGTEASEDGEQNAGSSRDEQGNGPLENEENAGSSAGEQGNEPLEIEGSGEFSTNEQGNEVLEDEENAGSSVNEKGNGSSEVEEITKSLTSEHGNRPVEFEENAGFSTKEQDVEASSEDGETQNSGVEDTKYGTESKVVDREESGKEVELLDGAVGHLNEVPVEAKKASAEGTAYGEVQARRLRRRLRRGDEGRRGRRKLDQGDADGEPQVEVEAQKEEAVEAQGGSAGVAVENQETGGAQGGAADAAVENQGAGEAQGGAADAAVENQGAGEAQGGAAGAGTEHEKGFPDFHMAPNGAVRGKMECPNTKQGYRAGDIENIATWKNVPGDAEYRGPRLRAQQNTNETLYVTIEKDLGGFNNVRMSVECGVAFAASTGRTFVIPPPFPIWHMSMHLPRKEVDLRNLFSFDKLRASGRVNVITMAEFLVKEAYTGKLGIEPSEMVKRLDVKAVSEYMREVAAQYDHGIPGLPPDKGGIVFPRVLGENVDPESPAYNQIRTWLYGRQLVQYRDAWETAKVIHWRVDTTRLLAPFYAFVYHSDKTADRYYKRLMRDFFHYPEEVYCKASQVISLLRKEDPSGTFSSFHVRRTDFKKYYKPSNILPEEVIENSKEHLHEGEVLYISTDEKDHGVFDSVRTKYRIRFLSDYYEEAGVAELDSRTLGMLEQVIASHGRTFTGCWFSTFSAYILRLRGYLELPRHSSFYYQPSQMKHPHTYRLPSGPLWATEWAFGWEGIDNTGPPDPDAP